MDLWQVKRLVEEKIKIKPAKGRPMLQWVGKKPLDYIKSFPAQLVETFDPTNKAKPIENPTYNKLKDNWQNLLFHGDNKEVLSYLLANGFRGKVDLIYIDPPFDSGANYIRKVELRGNEKGPKLIGEDYSVGEQVQYRDIWANDSYLQYMYERIILLKELLSDKGAIFVHLDSRRVHQIKIIMDEIFGNENFRNEIIWHYSNKVSRSSKDFPKNKDNILFYAKSEDNYFEEQKVGREKPVQLSKRIWKDKKNMRARDKDGKIIYETSYNKTVDDVWDIPIIGSTSSERSDYPTQKPEELLKRIILSSSPIKGIVLDAFIGSGTTQREAQKLGRKWIGVDINKGAIQTTSKILQKIIKKQFKEESDKNKQKKLVKKEKSNHEFYSFAHYKVNDYDLQLLRTEAIELAIQHIGIQRTKTDSFFEGTLGRNLVKIIDFNHPLTLLDLQLIKDELKKRPEENRNVTIVCLGKELTVDPWVNDYNKKHPVNKFEVVELKTDKKYGKFLIHKSVEAKVEVKRKGDKAVIKIKNFISPTIIERLNDEEKIVKVKLPDFRSMIDFVLIDNNYNGKVFNIAYSDVPEKKNDLVQGEYEIELSKKKTKVAVKIVDMLGEEVLVSKEI